MRTLNPQIYYFKAVSYFRRRKYKECISMCNMIINSGLSNEQSTGQKSGHLDFHQLKYYSNNHKTRANSNLAIAPWMMENLWQLRIRASTLKMCFYNLDASNVGITECADTGLFNFSAMTARENSVKSALVRAPNTAGSGTRNFDKTWYAASYQSNRPQSSYTIVRPSTNATSSSLSVTDCHLSGIPSHSYAQLSRAMSSDISNLATHSNSHMYPEQETLTKPLFQYLFYIDSNIAESLALCKAVVENNKKKKNASGINTSLITSWWWTQQIGRCLLSLRSLQKAKQYLEESVASFPHPETYLLLSLLYQWLSQPKLALKIVSAATNKHPFNTTFRAERGHILNAINESVKANKAYRLMSKINPINTKALSYIALTYFYESNPEMSLMYYRRILSLGIFTSELYCNIALCCLYGGQIDLVLPCLERAMQSAKNNSQKSDIWYNFSFAAISVGDLSLARRCLQLCLTLKSSNNTALNNLAVLSLHSGDIVKCKSYMNCIKKLMRDIPEISNNNKYMDKLYEL